MTDESKIFGSKSSTHQNSVFNIKPELLKPIGEVYHKEKKLVNSILDLFQDVHISSSTNALALHPTSPPFSSSLSHPYYTESTISVKEKVLWISLINPFDVDASIKKLDEEVSSIPYFIAALGFSQGLQLWLIFPDNIGCQSATQVFSLRNIGFVSIFRFLSNPSPLQSFGESTLDSYANQRPLFLIFSSQTHSNNNSQVLFFPVNFYSLKTGDKVNELKFASVVLDVQCNAHYIVLSLEDKFSILDAKNLKKISNIITHNTPAKSSSLPNYENSASYSILDSSTPFRRNPFCLGKRWLAISQNSTSKWSHPSLGGYKNSVQSTYTSSVLKAAQSLTRVRF